jgi:y4mF family transcriptional regulator
MAKQRRSRTPLHVRASDYGVIAALVTGRRDELGLRQEELADLAGCSTRFVHAVETGKPSVQLDKLLSLLATLGLHLEIHGETAESGVTASQELSEIYRLEAD